MESLQNTRATQKPHIGNFGTMVRNIPFIFNPVRFLVIDPMHCLFLGIAKWIVTRLWIEKGRLTSQNLLTMQKRADKIQVPADIGRIPSKISTGTGFLVLPPTNGKRL